MRTFLWVYGHEVLEAQGLTSLDTFKKAREAYRNLADVEPLDSIETPESYFTSRGAGSGDGTFVIVKLGALNKRRTSSKKRQAANADSEHGEALLGTRLHSRPLQQAIPYTFCIQQIIPLASCF
jgi:hypothetical protein